VRVYPVWVCLLGACFDPSVPAAAQCSPAIACPGGQHCEAAACVADADGGTPDAPIDAPIDAGLPGPPPPADAGPQAMGCPPLSATLDEDGDGVPDAVDPCPLAAGTDDGDGDGVSGICDRSAGRDMITCFEGFASGLPAGWGHENDTAASSAIVLTGAPEAGLEPPFLIGDPSSVLVAMTFLPPLANAVLFEVAITDRSTCTIIDLGLANRWQLDLNGDETMFTSSSAAFTLAMGHVGAQFTCSVYARGGAAPLATLTGTIPTAGLPLSVSLGVFMATVQIESVLVVGAPMSARAPATP